MSARRKPDPGPDWLGDNWPVISERHRRGLSAAAAVSIFTVVTVALLVAITYGAEALARVLA